jgi:phage-related protein
MGFRVGNRFILTHEFAKKDNETPPEETSRAQRLKAAYLAEMGS